MKSIVKFQIDHFFVNVFLDADGTVGALERDWTLTDWRPYRISWRRLRLCVAHQTVAPALALAAVNASLVALLWLDDAAEASVVRYRADATADQGQGSVSSFFFRPSLRRVQFFPIEGGKLPPGVTFT